MLSSGLPQSALIDDLHVSCAEENRSGVQDAEKQQAGPGSAPAVSKAAAVRNASHGLHQGAPHNSARVSKATDAAQPEQQQPAFVVAGAARTEDR